MPPLAAIILDIVFSWMRIWVKVVRRSDTSPWLRPESRASRRFTFALFAILSGFSRSSSVMHCNRVRSGE